MSDVVAVDVAQLGRMSLECRRLATELRAGIAAFHEQTAQAGNAYGRTDRAATAANEYRETTMSALAWLERLHRELMTAADRQRIGAAVHLVADAGTEEIAADLRRVS